jgi:hypothetical protein
VAVNPSRISETLTPGDTGRRHSVSVAIASSFDSAARTNGRAAVAASCSRPVGAATVESRRIVQKSPIGSTPL